MDICGTVSRVDFGRFVVHCSWF